MTVPGPSVEIRAAFARAVSANDRAMVITPDNEKDRWCKLTEAVRLDEAFAVKARDGLVAVDADHSPDDAMQFIHFLHDLGLTPVVLSSGQPDRFHIFVSCEDDHLRRKIMAEASRLGLDVRHGGSLIRPPLAMHRSRTFRSELIEPLDEADALRLLVPPLPEPLSPKLNALLRYGDLFDEYAKRSAAEQAVIEGLRGLMVPAERIEELLTDPANVGGHHFQERTDKGWGATDLDRSLRKADERIAGRGLQLLGGPALQAIEQLHAAARARAWPGRTGSTDFKVYEAHLSHALERKRTEYAASIRDIQLRAGLGSTTTVRDAQRRLIEADLLHKKGRPKGTDAQEWALMPCELDTLPSPYMGGRELPSVSATLGTEAHDVFRYGGLGSGPLHTLKTLSALTEPVSVVELAALTGKHRTTTKSHLDRLRAHGLATPIGGRWTAGTADLDSVADALGVAGLGGHQAERIALERAAYREFVEARAELRSVQMAQSGSRFGGPYLTAKRVKSYMRSKAHGRAMVVP